MDNGYFISECYDLETLLRVAVGRYAHVCTYECMPAFMHVCMYMCMFVLIMYMHELQACVFIYVIEIVISKLLKRRSKAKYRVVGTSLITSAE